MITKEEAKSQGLVYTGTWVNTDDPKDSRIKSEIAHWKSLGYKTAIVNKGHDTLAIFRSKDPSKEHKESSMKDTKRVREGAPEFEPEDDEFEEEGFEGEPEGEEFEDEEFEDEEGMPEGEEFEDEFEDEEDDGGIEAGVITVGSQRYCVVLYPMDDEEEEFEEEEAEGETPEEEAEEGVEGETEEERAEHEGGENPFAARDEDLKEEELEEAIRIGMSDTEILQLYGEVRRPRAKARGVGREKDSKQPEGEDMNYGRKKPVQANSKDPTK